LERLGHRVSLEPVSEETAAAFPKLVLLKTITSAALDGAYEQGENGPQIGVPQLALVLLYIVQLHCTKHHISIHDNRLHMMPKKRQALFVIFLILLTVGILK